MINLDLEKIKIIFYFFLLAIILGNFYLIKKKGINFIEKNSIYLFLALICFIISITLASSPTLSWEAQTIWFEKTILLFHNNKIQSFVDGPGPELPILLPIIWSFFWEIFNTNYEYFGRIFLVFLYLLSILNFIELFKLKFYQRIFAFLLFVLLSFKIEYFQGDPIILAFCLILTSVKSLSEIFFYNRLSKFNLAILFLNINLIIWTLNEGIFYSFFIISSLIILGNKLRKNNFIFKIIFFYFILVFLRIYFLEIYSINFSLNSDDYKFYNLVNNLNLENLFLIIKYYIINFLRTEILLFSIPFAIYYFAAFSSSKEKKLCLYLFLINVLFIFSFFLFNGETMEGILKQKMIPLLFLSSPFYLLPFVFLIKSKFKNI